MNAICQDDVTQKINTCDTNPGYIRGELDFMQAYSREEGSDCRYMMEGIVVRADCVVKIHDNVIETGRNESHDQDESSRSAGCAWGHAEPFIESVGGAKGSQGDSIRMVC